MTKNVSKNEKAGIAAGQVFRLIAVPHLCGQAPDVVLIQQVP